MKSMILAMAAICALAFSLHAGPLDSWTSRSSGTTNALYGVTFANGTFVVVGSLGTILTSTDGVGWTRQNSGTTNALLGVAFDGTTWVASGFGGTILTSTNLLAWASQNSGTATNLGRCTYANGTFVVMGFQNGTIVTSTKAVNWISRSSGTTNLFQNIAYGNGTFVTVGKYGGVATSATGVTWSSQHSGTTTDLAGLAYGDGLFVASGDLVLLTSADGITWASQNSGATSELSGMGYGNGIFVGVGSASGSKTVMDTSPEGTNWTIRVAEAGPGFYGVAYGVGTFVAVGNSGTILQSGNIALPQMVFPIATNPAVIQFSDGIAFDGTNYLVELLTGSNPSTFTNLSVQLVSPNGTLLGSPTVVGGGGSLRTTVGLAFGRTNYLVAWSDSTMSSGVDMFGQFISRTGAKVGSAFNLLPSQGSYGFQTVKALASDGTNFLAVWQDGNDNNFYGQVVTPGGALSDAAFLISSQQQNAPPAAMTFGKTNYLVVWGSGNGSATQSQTFGEIVSGIGSAGTPFEIGETASTDQPKVGGMAVAFDGTNYLAVWNLDTGPESELSKTNWLVNGRLVSQNGTFPGSEIGLLTNQNQVVPELAFDGANYLLAYGFDSNTTNSDANLRCQFLGHSANLVGPIFTPFAAQGTNLPFFALNGILFDGTRFAVAAAVGTLEPGGNPASGEVFGAFLPASTAPPTLASTGPPVGTQFPLLLTGTPGINYAIQVSTNLAVNHWNAVVTNSPTNGAFNFTDTAATNISRFYRAVKQ